MPSRRRKHATRAVQHTHAFATAKIREIREIAVRAGAETCGHAGAAHKDDSRACDFGGVVTTAVVKRMRVHARGHAAQCDWQWEEARAKHAGTHAVADSTDAAGAARKVDSRACDFGGVGARTVLRSNVHVCCEHMAMCGKRGEHVYSGGIPAISAVSAGRGGRAGKGPFSSPWFWRGRRAHRSQAAVPARTATFNATAYRCCRFHMFERDAMAATVLEMSITDLRSCPKKTGRPEVAVPCAEGRTEAPHRGVRKVLNGASAG